MDYKLIKSQDPLVKLAYLFAHKAHALQKRKYTLDPYINHPVAVARLVEEHGGTVEMIAAALLHDVLEDTPTTVEGLLPLFGENITKYVVELTDVYTSEAFPNMNRYARKGNECKRLSKVSKQAQTIKLCDLIDNSSSIVKFDKSFARTYLREKQEMLEVLTKGNKTLLTKAKEVLKNSLKELN